MLRQELRAVSCVKKYRTRGKEKMLCPSLPSMGPTGTTAGSKDVMTKTVTNCNNKNSCVTASFPTISPSTFWPLRHHICRGMEQHVVVRPFAVVDNESSCHGLHTLTKHAYTCTYVRAHAQLCHILFMDTGMPCGSSAEDFVQKIGQHLYIEAQNKITRKFPSSCFC